MLSEIAGIQHILCERERMLERILNTVENTEIPMTQFFPPNNRTGAVRRCILYSNGGYIDFTASNDPFLEEGIGEVRTSKGLKPLLEKMSPPNCLHFLRCAGKSAADAMRKKIVASGRRKAGQHTEKSQNCVLDRKSLEQRQRAVYRKSRKILKPPAKGRIEPGSTQTCAAYLTGRCSCVLGFLQRKAHGFLAEAGRLRRI
jgi:hypothetical protein